MSIEARREKILQLLNESGSPPVVLAPMVEVNDLSFRLMIRRHGIKLCWTGMINTHMWALHPNERNSYFSTCDEDRPLICQLSGNDETELITCAKDIQHLCDAIDINLGCAQHIARRGQYGYYMVNTEQKRQNVIQLVKNVIDVISVPLTVKIRILCDADGEPDLEQTAAFAHQLEEAGVALISVHGRHKRLDKAGLVSAEAIQAVIKSVSLPVLANGGITSITDSKSLLEATGAFGTMVGQGLLTNPHMFDPINQDIKPIAFSKEYLDIYKKHGSDFLAAKRHIFNFFNDIIRNTPGTAEKIKSTHTVEQLEEFLKGIDVNE